MWALSSRGNQTATNPRGRFLLSASLATGCCPLWVMLEFLPFPGRCLLGRLQVAFLGARLGSLPQGPPGGPGASALRELETQGPEKPGLVHGRPSCTPFPALRCWAALEWLHPDCCVLSSVTRPSIPAIHPVQGLLLESELRAGLGAIPWTRSPLSVSSRKTCTFFCTRRVRRQSGEKHTWKKRFKASVWVPVSRRSHGSSPTEANIFCNRTWSGFWGLITNTEGQIAALIISAWTLFGQVYNLSNVQHFRFCFCFFLFSGPALSCFYDVLFERSLLASQQLFGNFQHVSHDLIILFGREGSSREAKFIQIRREIQIRTWDWRSGHTPVLFGSWSFLLIWISWNDSGYACRYFWDSI